MQNAIQIDWTQEFPEISYQTWLEVLTKSLKGSDPGKLKWQLEKNISLNPFYTQESLAELGYLTNTTPGEFPYLRGNSKESNTWRIRQEIFSTDLSEAIRQVDLALAGGADDISFYSRYGRSSCTGIPIHTQADFESILTHINFKKNKIHLDFGFASPIGIPMLCQALETGEMSGDEILGSLVYDPVSSLASWKNLDSNRYINHTSDMLRMAKRVLPHFRCLSIQGQHYREAGCSISQELAFVLAIGAEYLDKLSNLGWSPAEILSTIELSFSSSTQYLVEIAKFRAARLLWAQLAKSFLPVNSPVKPTLIHASGLRTQLTVLDTENNLLRQSMQAMAAAIGACDSISLLPYDFPKTLPSNISYRMARNTQLILRNECHLDRVVDASAGSYFLESTTNQLIEEAWKLFLKIEDQGGFLRASDQGLIEAMIVENKKEIELQVARRKHAITGVNQYPNAKEKLTTYSFEPTAFKSFLDEQPIALKESAGMEAINQAIQMGVSFDRMVEILGNNIEDLEPKLESFIPSAPFENIRLRLEQFVRDGNLRPQVFLWVFGDAKMRRARAGFVLNLFGCAGFEVVDHPGFSEENEALKFFDLVHAKMIVFCGADAEYPNWLPSALDKIKSKNTSLQCYLAGPAGLLSPDIEIKLTDSINLKTDTLHFLETCLKSRGIS